MLIWWGGRSTGRVYNNSNELISTIFFHIWFIPLYPVCSTLVSKKGYIKDEGTEIPLNWLSVFAGYLRHISFAVICVGFSLAFDGLILSWRIDEQQQGLIQIGAIIYSIGFVVWLLMMFALGAKSNYDGLTGSTIVRLISGLFAGITIFGILYAIGMNLPRKLSQEETMQTFLDDKTLTDEQVIYKISKEILQKEDALEIKQGTDGIEVHFVKFFEPEVRMLRTNNQTQLKPNELQKLRTMWSLLLKIKGIAIYGEERGLARIIVSAKTKMLDEDNNPFEFEALRLNIPADKFDEFKKKSISELMRNQDIDFFDKLGVVEIDNFHLMTYEEN